MCVGRSHLAVDVALSLLHMTMQAEKTIVGENWWGERTAEDLQRKNPLQASVSALST